MNLGGLIRLTGALMLAAACSGGETPADTGNNGNNGNNNPPTNPGGSPVPSASIDVGNNFFNPNSVLLAAGGTVTWTWVGSGHSVTSDGSPSFAPNAPISNAPNTLVVTFATAGDYRYFCLVHGVSGGYTSGSMVGEVFVR